MIIYSKKKIVVCFILLFLLILNDKPNVYVEKFIQGLAHHNYFLYLKFIGIRSNIKLIKSETERNIKISKDDVEILFDHECVLLHELAHLAIFLDNKDRIYERERVIDDYYLKIIKFSSEDLYNKCKNYRTDKK